MQITPEQRGVIQLYNFKETLQKSPKITLDNQYAKVIDSQQASSKKIGNQNAIKNLKNYYNASNSRSPSLRSARSRSSIG